MAAPKLKIGSFKTIEEYSNDLWRFYFHHYCVVECTDGKVSLKYVFTRLKTRDSSSYRKCTEERVAELMRMDSIATPEPYIKGWVDYDGKVYYDEERTQPVDRMS